MLFEFDLGPMQAVTNQLRYLKPSEESLPLTKPELEGANSPSDSKQSRNDLQSHEFRRILLFIISTATQGADG